MPIQQDILDTIGEDGIETSRLYGAVGNIGQRELDCAVHALMRANRIRQTEGSAGKPARYELVRLAPGPKPASHFTPPDPLAKLPEPPPGAPPPTSRGRRPPHRIEASGTSVPGPPIDSQAREVKISPSFNVVNDISHLQADPCNESFKPLSSTDDHLLAYMRQCRTSLLALIEESDATILSLQHHAAILRKRLKACDDLVAIWTQAPHVCAEASTNGKGDLA